MLFAARTGAEVLTFQQGDGGIYSENACTWIEERNTTNWGSEVNVKLEEEYRTTTHLLTQGLLGFFHVIGDAPGQVPSGATIHSATLRLVFDDAGVAGAPVTLHQMLKPWVENEATWVQRSAGQTFGNNPFVATVGAPVKAGGGAEGVDYSATVIAAQAPAALGALTFDITSAVQTWANGTPNHGFYLRYRNGNMARFHSDDAPTLASRPLLTVEFTPANPASVLTASSTAGSTVLQPGDLFDVQLDWSGSDAVAAADYSVLLNTGQLVLTGRTFQPSLAPFADTPYLTDFPLSTERVEITWFKDSGFTGTDVTLHFQVPLSYTGPSTVTVDLQVDGAQAPGGTDLEVSTVRTTLAINPATPNPPTVAITAPANNAIFTASATVSITANATDSDGTVAKVEFFQGDTKLGEATAAPFAFDWTGVTQGNYVLTARATDNTGQTTTSAPVNITVGPPDTVFPFVALTAPAGSASFIAPATVEITADAADTDGTISKVEFFQGSTKLGEDTETPYEFSWTNVSVGSYVLTAKATDNLTAATTSAPVNITVTPNQAPTITLVSPTDLASLGSSGTVNLSASVSDPESAPLTVTFYGRPKLAPAGPDFTLVSIPDTQIYSQDSGGSRFHLFESQTNWIVSVRDLLNVSFVAHMGDMVQNNDSVPAEWQRASQAMGYIENTATTGRPMGIPWGGAPGNHDGNGSSWNSYFGSNRWLDNGRTYFQGNYNNSNTNNYQFFSASGMDFIVINLAYNGSTGGNQAIMNWADALLKAHPNRRAIVTSHFLINTSFPPTQATWGGHGQAVYDNLKDNPNLFMMLCGHIHGEGRRSDTFQGRTVNTVLQDYQSRSNGGDSWLRYFTFKPSENKIYAYTYKTNTAPVGNPLGGTFETDADSQFTLDYNMTATAPWTALGTLNLAGGETTATVTWNGLAANTEFEWYAAVSDPVNTPVGSTVRTFTTNGNAAPTVTLTSPSSGTEFAVPATVPLAATADDIDGTIAKVEFYQGSTKVGEDTEPPFTFDWSAPAGTYSLNARATDGQGTTTDSAAVSITVIDPLPTVTIVATDASAGEFGPDQALEFTITRSGSTTGALSVQFSPGGNASAADYSGYSGNMESIIIPIGQASFTLPITVLADAIAEGPETLTLSLNPAPNYIIGSPSSADATIADRPDQAAYFTEISDPAKRGPADDGDGDGVPNAIEHFMGTLVGDPSSSGQLQILEPGPGSFKIRYPRAKNRPELTGSLRWSTDLTTWHDSGGTDGTLNLTFDEAVISTPGADPEIIEATATVTGGSATNAFVHLRVE